MNISPHFTLAEMTVTNTGLDNTPNAMHLAHLKDLCENVLELVRRGLKSPVMISSGYRSSAVNAKVGGALDSQHTRGEAADIKVPGVDNKDVWQFIVDHLPFDQCIAEYLDENDGSKGWVHVSYRHGNNRRQAISCIAKGVYVDGLQFKGVV